MGHANVKELCEFFVKLLYEKRKLSLQEAIEGAVKKGCILGASEGPNDDEGMVGMGIELCVAWLWEDQRVIEPHDLTKLQKRALEQWSDTPVLSEDEQRMLRAIGKVLDK